jgi:ABC-type polysaccharide/polyol phosphate transport system ATPase subunit
LAIIELKDVSKSFKIYSDRAVTLKEKVLFSSRRSHQMHEVLKEIYLSVDKGEVVGLIGENGCGKSTLLKLMTGILYPEAGTIDIKGRISSLLELGAGFHPDLSGRDNIYTNASIFGLTRKETNLRFQDIVDFSELHQYIDSPVRTYSSGMYMRLAFSVAINVDADILLIDEILAVGDTNFQVKCFNKLNQLKKKGITIVLVTHDMGVIENFCNRAIWLNNGKIAKDGDKYFVTDAYKKYMSDKQMRLFNNGKDFDMDDIIYAYNYYLDRPPESEKTILHYYNLCQNLQELIKYLKESDEYFAVSERKGFNRFPGYALDENFEVFRQQMRQKKETEANAVETDENKDVNADNSAFNRFGNRKIMITNVMFLNKEGIKTTVLKEGEDVTLCIEYKQYEPPENCVFGFEIHTLDGIHCYGTNTKIDHCLIERPSDYNVIHCEIKKLNLAAGEYRLGVAAEDDATPMDYIRNYMSFNVVSDKKSVGVLTLDHQWKLE